MPITGIYGPEDLGREYLGGPAHGLPVAPTNSRVSPTPHADALPMPSLEWTAEVERDTAHLYERVKSVIPPIEWPLLQLAIEATKVKADTIVQCGVHFMAETSKILNPHKTVLIPDSRAGCSLAASITGADVRLLRERFPGVPVVAYVNTSADVKAAVDICCTSSNAVEVVESLNAPTVIFLPDQYLAKYVASKTNVKIIAWKGACEVHERFTGDELRAYREADPSVQIIAHPECPPDVLAEADFTGSTAHMIKWVRDKHPKRVVMITECSMADNVRAELPDIEMVQPCNLCPHMQRITLPKILDSLLYLREEVVVDPVIADKARRSVERMINLRN